MNAASTIRLSLRAPRPLPWAGWGVRVTLGLLALGFLLSAKLSAQETLPPAPNPYAVLGIPAGPYSTGVGNLASGAPDDPIPGFINGQVNPLILGWASVVADYSPANPTAISSSWKNIDNVLQPVTGNVFDVVSLGDLSAVDISHGVPSGTLTVKFDQPVGDGPGPDFVIFGNAFQLARSARVFAKLAYVEVSTDGATFARFPSVDTNPRPSGTGWPYITSDATKIYNLFGKAVNAYGPSWGNPFDLRDLASHPLVQAGILDLQNIHYVRLVAIPGSGSYQDSFGNPIYSPWPTYGSPGPEVQAIGYLNLGHPVPKDSPVNVIKKSAVIAANATAATAPVAVRPVLVSPRGSSAAAYAGSPVFNSLAETNPISTPDASMADSPSTAADDNASPADVDSADAGEVAVILAGKAKGAADLTSSSSSSFASPVTNNGPFSAPTSSAYEDRSFYPSGIQARINSFRPTLWGRTVQRVAYITGWEPTPVSLAALFLAAVAGILLAVRYFRSRKTSGAQR